VRSVANHGVGDGSEVGGGRHGQAGRVERYEEGIEHVMSQVVGLSRA
jgi:hypothetical protein